MDQPTNVQPSNATDTAAPPSMPGITSMTSGAPAPTESNVSRETKPPVETPTAPPEALSPRFAKLASSEANLRKRSQEIREKERQLEIAQKAVGSLEELKKRASTDPVAVAKELGMSYETWTKALLSDGQTTPDTVYKELQSEIKELKDQLGKTVTDQQTKEYAEVERKWKVDVKTFAETNADKYELAANLGIPIEELVANKVKATYHTTKKMLRHDEALDLLEKDVDNDLRTLLKTKKGQAIAKELLGLTQEPAPAKNPAPTLTNSAAAVQHTPREKFLGREESLAEAARLIKHRIPG